jgi:NAD(P)-dependent dehydrogenase (short-subunit alcohol dehydrogenase family)
MHPMPGSASVSMVNAGLEGFVRAAALEMPRKLRINAVSPPWVKETMVKLGMDPTPGLASADVAKAYGGRSRGLAPGSYPRPSPSENTRRQALRVRGPRRILVKVTLSRRGDGHEVTS